MPLGGDRDRGARPARRQEDHARRHLRRPPARHDDGRPRRRDRRRPQPIRPRRTTCSARRTRRPPTSLSSTKRCTSRSTSASPFASARWCRATSSTSPIPTSRAAGRSRDPGRRDGGCGAVHARGAAQVPGRLHADRQRRDRRGRVPADQRRGHEEGCGRDDRARAPYRDRRRDGRRPGGRDTVFLVNPAAANGSTGRRWPEIAHKAAGVGLEGDALLSERRGHLGELAREAALAGSRLLVVVGGDGSINEVVNGLDGIENLRLSLSSRAARGATSSARSGSRTTSRPRPGSRSPATRGRSTSAGSATGAGTAATARRSSPTSRAPA